MDILTQYLFNTAKKIRELLTQINQDIHKASSQIEADAAERHTSRAQQQPAPVVLAELHRSQAEIDHEEARHARTEGRDEKRLGIESIALGIAGIVAFANAPHRKSAAASSAQAQAAEVQTELSKKSAETTLD